MKISREMVYDALFQLMKQAPGLTLASRRAIPFSELKSKGQLPALLQYEKSETPISRSDARLPYAWQLEVTLVIWVSSNQDPSFIPTTPLNNILDYIEEQLPPSIGYGQLRQTLGVAGVQSACIHGVIEKDEGVIAPDSYAIVPVQILVISPMLYISPSTTFDSTTGLFDDTPGTFDSPGGVNTPSTTFDSTTGLFDDTPGTFEP